MNQENREISTDMMKDLLPIWISQASFCLEGQTTSACFISSVCLFNFFFMQVNRERLICYLINTGRLPSPMLPNNLHWYINVFMESISLFPNCYMAGSCKPMMQEIPKFPRTITVSVCLVSKETGEQCCEICIL